MTERDVLIARVFDGSAAAPQAGADEGPWQLTGAGKTARTFDGFREAYDVALLWANETGGDVYRLSTRDGDPELYTPAG
jgi:hypothetical protein